ncbi:MAG: hypothetical protein ACTSRP_15900 [Candidatus Helarchaeota archaeon]
MDNEIKAIIGFDTTQNERGKLEDNYTTFKSLLVEDGYSLYTNFEFPLSMGQLSKCDIIFFACPDRSKFRDYEIEQIIQYIKYGGNVVFMSNAGGDKGLGTNLNEVGKEFGITCNNDQVCDDERNYGIRTLPLSQKFNLHPITTEIELLLLPSACSLNISKDAIPIVSSEDTADPPNAPVIAVAEKGLGKFVFFGTYEIFRDNIRGGIQVIQHRNLLKNLIDWLLEDIEHKRIILSIQNVINAIAYTRRKKEKKEKGTQPIKIVPTAPIVKTPDGKVSPESMLDQIITSLQQLKDITGNLDIINNNLVAYAREVQLLRNEIKPISNGMSVLTEEMSNVSKLINELKEEIQSIKMADSLKEVINIFKDFKMNFESQVDIILNKNLNPLKMEFSEMNETLASNKVEIKTIKKELDNIKGNYLTREDINNFKKEIVDEIKNILKELKESDE